MKKILLLCVLTAILSVLLTGCTKEDAVGEKLCRIEILNAAEHDSVTVLEQQRQADVSEFFDENNWTETAGSSGELTPQYVISLYQEKTPTVIKEENGEPYEKIMEYVTYENSETVKVSIGGDLVNGFVSDEFLTGYYIGSEKFFSSLNEALNS
ncbi:MAG: hypothetical protein HDT21_02080 [Ruminococcus sp.]|nr:hypothetical protein [Ruminococcus sp.]